MEDPTSKLPCGITQCYLPSIITHHAFPNPSQAGWYSIYLPPQRGLAESLPCLNRDVVCHCLATFGNYHNLYKYTGTTASLQSHHRLNGSSSPVLTATCLSYGRLCDFLTFFSGTRLGVRRPNRSSRKMAQMTVVRGRTTGLQSIKLNQTLL